MGNTCFHSNYTISNIDPDTYEDKDKIWDYKVADLECHDCSQKYRAIRKTCKDHGIRQDWQVVVPKSCLHDYVSIKNEIASCVVCRTSVPVKYHNGEWIKR